MPRYNQIEFSNDYEKTSEGLSQFHKDDYNDNMKDSE